MSDAASSHPPAGSRFDICPDDLSGEAARALLVLHLAGMHATSPSGSVFALDLSGLLAPGVTVWSVWHGSDIAGIGALKELGQGAAEVKSMRTHPDHLRTGVAAALSITSSRRRGGGGSGR